MMETTKCLERKDGIKYSIIPKKSLIKKGDSVAIIKLDEDKLKEQIKKETIK